MKWATFTYIGKQTRFITKLFKNTNIKQLHKQNQEDDKSDNAGVYKLKWWDCTQYYIGQTGRTFNTQYKEHTRDTRDNKDGIGYTQHIKHKSHIWKYSRYHEHHTNNK
jgi:hypothetical protein